MFNNHQPTIQASALASPHGLERVVQFVSLTIRQPIEIVPDVLQDILDGAPDAERYLFGSKRATFAYAAENREELYADVMALFDSPLDDHAREDGIVDRFTRIPGIGLVKAGFVAQLACGVSGCIDSHNLARYGINPNTYRASRYDKASHGLKKSIVRAYHDHVRMLGGTAFLWDSWCDYVAALRGNMSGHDVSAIHLYACTD